MTCKDCPHRRWYGDLSLDYCDLIDKVVEEDTVCMIENNKDNKDNVNHPSHYETGKFECIDVMLETQGVEAVKSFCICNAFKYLYRHCKKNGLEDVKKAQWYLNKFIELENKNE